jgi:signal transduction histidine kinase/ligand-binding sensor domain-containing protein
MRVLRPGLPLAVSLQLLLFGFLLILAIPAMAGGLGPVFRTLGVVDGLPDSRVEAIVQDRHGYVWIGTQSGLVRHEGRALRRLSHDPSDPQALPGANIMSLHAHSDGQVWAAISGQGVVEIGPDLKPRRHLRPESAGGILLDTPVWSMSEDCQGGLWLAFMRGGVARYDLANDTLVHYAQDESRGLAEAGFQLQVHVDARCRVWVIQTERVAMLPALDAPAFQTIMARDREAGHPIFNAMHERPDGSILVVRNEQLLQAEPETGHEMLLEAGGTITGFAEASDGRLILSTYDGLLTWSPETGQIDRLGRIEGLSDGLPGNALGNVLLDTEGGLWLSVFRNGMAYLPPGHRAFARYQAVPGTEQGLGLNQVMGIAAVPGDSALWLGGHDQGIQRLDLDSGQVQWARDYFDDAQFEARRPATSLAPVGSALVFGWAREIWAYDPEQRQLRTVLERQQVDQGTFRFILADDDEHFWVATFDAGLIRVRLSDGERQQFHPDGAGVLHWPETEVNDLVRDSRGDWWVAGRQSVYRLSDQGRFQARLELATGPLLAMAWVADELWLASEHQLSRWRLLDGRLVQSAEIDLGDRLMGGRVFAIAAGQDGDIWLVLSNGLARLEPESGRFRLYSRPDGLAAAEFYRHSTLALADQRLAIGSSNGLVVVSPDQIVGASSAPPVHVAEVAAGERRISRMPGDRSPVVLDHRSNSLSIDYVALSYVFPQQSRYRLRLEGWDEDWLELVGQTRHFYSNLRPGKYRFQVQAATPEGLWNEAGDELALTILEPPWLSAWALAFYGLVLSAGAASGWRGLRLARRRRREMQEARQKRALAEEQRQVVERLNRNLAPDLLARVIGEELLAVTGGERAWLAYVHEQLPTEPVAVAGPKLDRAEWLARLQQPGEDVSQVELMAEGAPVARALIEAGPAGFRPEHSERLELLVQMAGQALHNLLLIERVRALAERAEQASAAKSEFLATMSHEIRTPLHGVMGMVELLYETESNPGQQELLNTLRQSGLQLQRIIDDVLDISRIEAGRLSLDNDDFELPVLLEQVIDLHAPNAARKNLDLRLRMASDLPLLAFGDAGRIAQVLGNLLSNAVKFTDSGGIELVAETGAPGQLKLSVADSGPGIRVEDRARLFEPFMQLDASITRSHSGSGLGLAICRRLVAAMQGELCLADRAGPGCRFELTLPVLDGSDAAQRLSGLLAGLRLAAALDPSGMRVLHRLARRWGIVVINVRRHPPQPIDALLLQRTEGSEAAALSSWRRQAASVIALDVPYSGSHSDRLPAADERLLRWPLIESRLIALLFDQVLESRR